MKPLIVSFCLTLLTISSCQQEGFAAHQEEVLLMKDVSKTDQEAAATLYLEDLESPNEKVRSRAAVALQRMGHPRALEACLRTLNDNPDILHWDDTPSLHCLVRIGKPALIPLLDRLLDDDQGTRLRAAGALEGITTKMLAKEGEERNDTEERWRKWWKGIGYSYNADPESRRVGVARLRNWIESH